MRFASGSVINGSGLGWCAVVLSTHTTPAQTGAVNPHACQIYK